MRRGSVVCLWLLSTCVLVECALAQSAPQRSEELCAALKQSSVEKGLGFRVTRPGACSVEIDKGYDLTVYYSETTLHLGLIVQTWLLNGDDNNTAFWLHLSALDNLSYVALGTKQQVVFDGLNKLSRRTAKEMEQGKTKPESAIMRFGKAQKAKLLVMMGPEADPGLWAQAVSFVASATPEDIDRMKRQGNQEAAGDVSTWRRVLATALLAFAAGAKGYEQGYRSYYQSHPRQQEQSTVCYTNFLGLTAITHCY